MAFISNQSLKKYISDLANNRQKGKSIIFDDFLMTCNTLRVEMLDDTFDEDKFLSFVENVRIKNSSIVELKKLNAAEPMAHPDKRNRH